jgi:hypothetical protein
MSTVRTLTAARQWEIFFQVVLPISFVPPIMLVCTSGENNVLVPATVLFLAEISTVFLMAWVMRDIAGTLKLRCTPSTIFAVAAVCPLPIWLSSLAMVFESGAILLVVTGLSLIGSALILYFSMRSRLEIADVEDALAISSTAFSVAGIMWFLVGTIFFVPFPA